MTLLFVFETHRPIIFRSRPARSERYDFKRKNAPGREVGDAPAAAIYRDHGLVHRGRDAQRRRPAFGLSDPAATKDLKLYSDLAPGNLVYNHSVFGFVPGDGLCRCLCRPRRRPSCCPIIAANLAVANGPYGDEPIYGLATASLPLPARLPSAQTLAQITRAIHGRRKLRVAYRSLSSARQPGAACSRAPHAGQYRAALACPGLQRGDLRFSRLRAVAHRAGRMSGHAGRIQRAVRRRLGGDRQAAPRARTPGWMRPGARACCWIMAWRRTR